MNVGLPQPTRLHSSVLPDRWHSTCEPLDGEFRGGRNGVARCSCVNTGGVLQRLCMLPALPGRATRPGRSPNRQARTKTKDWLT